VRLNQIYEATNQGIRQAVADLVKTVYLTQDQVDNFHRCLVVAVHCDSEKVWKKAVWR
jgi:formaldehyde-activating enzyme involved in methanogenesis